MKIFPQRVSKTLPYFQKNFFNFFSKSFEIFFLLFFWKFSMIFFSFIDVSWKIFMR